MTKALIVKEDGLIYAAEVPEKPKFVDTMEYVENCLNDKAMADWRKAINDAAVLVSDQEKAQQMIVNDYLKRGDGPPFKYRGSLVIGIGEGIYPIPDLQWEVKEELYMDKFFGSRKVAILKESTPSSHIADVGKMVGKTVFKINPQYLHINGEDHLIDTIICHSPTSTSSPELKDINVTQSEQELQARIKELESKLEGVEGQKEAFTLEDMKEACRKQRDLCFDAFWDYSCNSIHDEDGFRDAIKGAKEPDFDEWIKTRKK